jgi:hypothetical protein
MLARMLALLLAVALPAAADAPPALESRMTTTPVLLDGLCPEAEWRGAARVALDATHELMLMHDAEFAYACITGPADEHLTLDLYLLGTRKDPPLNLHASAQVGERMRGAHGWPPYEWWNHRDWYSPAVPFTGVAGEGDERRPQFATGKPRELQVRRARFGDGPWRAMLAVGGKRAADGSWQPLVFPPGAKDDAPDGWSEWSFGASAR